MNNPLFAISSLQRKLDANTSLRAILKGVGMLVVLTVFICSLSYADTMKIAWILSLIIVLLLFAIEVYLIKQNKDLEFQIYKLSADDIADRRKRSETEAITDAPSIYSAAPPSREVSLPILYYAVLIFLDILVKIILI